MAEYNIRIKVKTTSGYDTLFPETKGELVDFDNQTTKLSSINVQDAIKELNDKILNKTLTEELDIANNTQQGYYVDSLVIKKILQDMGNMPVIRSGNSLPSNSLGKDGDVYIKY